MKNKETIFKLGDKVFDARFGWQEVIIIGEEGTYPVIVKCNDGVNGYTNEGYYVEDDLFPSLSFTEYDFVNGGFSQERPQEVPKIGAICWVRNYEDSDWGISHFIEMRNSWFFTSRTNDKYNQVHWKYLTTINPYENAES